MNKQEWKQLYREFRLSVDKWLKCLLQNKKAADKVWNKGAGLQKFDFIHQMRRPDRLRDRVTGFEKARIYYGKPNLP